MENTTDLVAWLTQILNEDEAVAEAAAKVYGPTWFTDEYSEGVTGTDGGYVACGPYDCDLDEALRYHIARHDPAAVLAGIAAKRAIVDRYRVAMVNASGNDELNPNTQALLATFLWPLWDMATAYADRPGFNEEWRTGAAGERQEP